ncbi:MAG: extracellular solute-binding protein, partial [Chloroflexota bacterium]
MRKFFYLLICVVAVFSILLAACAKATPTAEPQPEPTQAPVAEAPTEAPVAEEPTEAPAAEEPTEAPVVEETTAKQIRWFIGLGAGGNPEEVAKEEEFVAKFNAANEGKYELVMDVVQNATAYDVLKTQIASGDVPDIVGPVGVRGLWSFEGAWLDLAPYIEKTGYDLSDFNPSLIEFYQLGPQGQVGLPFAVYPSALWYNKDLFDEAGIAYPPHEFGAAYEDGDEWTFDKLKELAMVLTVDENGNDATMTGFDSEKIGQFGYHSQWTDIRGGWTFFGASSFVGPDGNA